MFPRASRSNSRRLVGLLAVVGAVVALSVPPSAQARPASRPSTRTTAVSHPAPPEAGLFGRFLGLLRSVWQADGTVPTGPGGTPTTTTPPEGSGIDPHGTPKPKP